MISGISIIFLYLANNCLMIIFFLTTSNYCEIVFGEIVRDPASDQLEEFSISLKKPVSLTTSYGTPVDSKTTALTAGPKGPVLLQDTILIDEISHFDRERIPERVVHAKGAGAKGYFEVTHDITRYTKATVFKEIGKRTNIVVRFSQVAGERGAQDTVRDPRGFAIKFYTEDGIWDLVGNNTPIFFVRDPLLFPSFIHSQKRNPVTNLKDANMFWDMISLRPETTHQTLITFSDRGIPDGYRYMHGYGSHTFKLVNEQGQPIWCKFHYKSNQGIKNLPVERAAELASTDPDYSTRDLYNAIHDGSYPSWTLYIQVMTNEQAETFPWDIFDVTKVWPQGDFPLIPVGTLVLNKNPDNYFTDVEQAAFSPDHMIPGIEPSPDKMLQARLFAYGDTQRHRLGANYLQLPINWPCRTGIRNYQRDGPQSFLNQKGAPNYFPNSFSGPYETPEAASSSFLIYGYADRYSTKDEDNFSQATVFYRKVLDEGERERLVSNIVSHLKDAAEFIQERAVKNFAQVDRNFGERISIGLQYAKGNIK